MKQTIYVNESGAKGFVYRTIEEALDAVKNVGPNINEIEIVIQDGIYTVDNSISLSGKDFDGIKLTFRAENSGSVTFINAIEIKKKNFYHITDDMNINVSAEAKDHILYCDVSCGDENNGAVIYGESSRYTSAKWPNEGFGIIEDVLETGYSRASENEESREYVPPEKREVDKRACFKFDNERINKWADAKDAVIEGYFYWDWHYEAIPVGKIDLENRTISLNDSTVYGMRNNQRFRVSNLIEELDIPGEIFFDKDKNKLYIYPYNDFVNDEDKIYVALSKDPIFDLSNIANVSIQGIRFSYTREKMIEMKSCINCEISECIFEYCGTYPVNIQKSSNINVENCKFNNLGSGGIILDGGNREELIPSGNTVKGNDFGFFSVVHRTYTPAVLMSGCGHNVVENTIHDCPHCAILFMGNNHIMENNEMYNCAFETDDVGIIYTGRNWTFRGNVIRGNLIYDNHCSEVIYFDDMYSSAKVYNNIIVGTKRNGIMIGGGRDNEVNNNILVACKSGLHLDARATNWGYHMYKKDDGSDSTMTRTLKDMPYRSDLWKEFYPELYDILEDSPEYPKNNIMKDNIHIDCCDNYLADEAVDLNVFDVSLDYKGDPGKILKDLLIDSNAKGYTKKESLDKIIESFKDTWVLEKFKGKYDQIIKCLDDYKVEEK